MVKWNSSQLLESKMEDEQKSKFYYKAAKYCFDKFKSNSFKRTEFSVKELEKIGIKNIKYPLYIRMGNPEGEDSEIFRLHPNARGFINFDSKFNSFFIVILEKDCKTDEEMFNSYFLHEFTHFLQYKSVQNPKPLFIPWSLENLIDCYFEESEIDEDIKNLNKKLREDMKCFFYYFNNFEIYARNN